jgi:hypothetical protein
MENEPRTINTPFILLLLRQTFWLNNMPEPRVAFMAVTHTLSRGHILSPKLVVAQFSPPFMRLREAKAN